MSNIKIKNSKYTINIKVPSMNAAPVYIKTNQDFLEYVTKSRKPVVVIFYHDYPDRISHMIETPAFVNTMADALANHTPSIQLAVCKIADDGYDSNDDTRSIAGRYGIRSFLSMLIFEYDRVEKYYNIFDYGSFSVTDVMNKVNEYYND
jgi:hypothetical protein